MTKTAFLCSGQGAQAVSMGIDFAQNIPACGELFALANEACGIDVHKLCEEGPIEELSLTQNTQPALVTTSLVIARALRERGVEPDCVAGFSLGEYAAHAIAGTTSEELALQLVARRGALMAHAAQATPGAMAALLKCDLAQAAALCEAHAGDDVLVPANLNCPGQVVISGAEAALNAACEDWKAQGGCFAKLATSGAFHSPLMEQAARGMAPALESVEFAPARIPLYCNVTALPLQHGDEASSLIRQITSPVLWEDTIRNMIGDGVERFVECGPGKVLTGMVKRTARDMGATVELVSVATVEDLEAIDG